MGIALFHLLPEASENFEKHYMENDQDSVWRKLPTPFFISFISYSLILFVEKVAFDSHSITEHDHGGHIHPVHHTQDSKHTEHKGSELYQPLLEGLLIQKEAPILDQINEEVSDIDKTNSFKKKARYENEEEEEEDTNTKPKVHCKVTKVSSQHVPCEGSSKRASNDNIMKMKETGYDNEEDLESDYFLYSENEDDDEQTMKNVVSSKGKFASYLQARNIMQSAKPHMKVDKSLLTASKILERAHVNRQDSIDKMCVTNLSSPSVRKQSVYKAYPKETTRKSFKASVPLEQIGELIGQLKKEEVLSIEHKHKKQEVIIEKQEKHHFNPKSNLTPYLLLIALSVHGLFEGTALGVQRELKDTVFLAIAIVAHKWAESFTLGISFSKSSTEKGSYIRMIILFAVFTPIGILLGLLVISADSLTQGIFLSISAGTFIYISASEVIVEEFAITKYRFEKYFLFLCGGILVGLLSYFEVMNSID